MSDVCVDHRCVKKRESTPHQRADWTVALAEMKKKCKTGEIKKDRVLMVRAVAQQEQ